MNTPSSLPAAPIRPAGPPVTVEQITDVNTWCVQVRLDPASIVKALADDLKGHNAAMMLVRRLPADHPEHIRARAELAVILADTLTVTLTPEQASVVESALYYAADEPTRCFHCEAFAAAVVNGVPLCGGHLRALDQVQQVHS